MNPYTTFGDEVSAVQWAAAVLNARVAGMVADNTARERRGEAPAFSQRAFEQEIEYARRSLAEMGHAPKGQAGEGGA